MPGNLDVDFANAKSLSTFLAKAKIDAGAIDLKRQSLRGIGEIDFSRRTEPGNELVTYERNRFLAGVRVDVWKVRRFGDLRPFVGYFWEGPLERTTTELTPSRTASTLTDAGVTFKQTETPDFKVPVVVERNVFRYLSVGVDMYTSASLSKVQRWTRIPVLGKLDPSFTRLKLQGDRGDASRVPLELHIGKWRLDELLRACPSSSNDALRNGDAQSFVNATFDCPGGRDFLLAADRRVQITSETRPQRRLQIEADGAVSADLRKRTYKLAISYQKRWYEVRGGAIDLAVRQSQKTTLQLTFPLFWRLELAPTYERQTVEIFAPLNNRYSVTRWDVRIKLPIFGTMGPGAFVQ